MLPIPLKQTYIDISGEEFTNDFLLGMRVLYSRYKKTVHWLWSSENFDDWNWAEAGWEMIV